MLNFFRTYQRSCFLITSVVVIISFVFFGTYDRTRAGEPVYENKSIGKLFNGSSLNESDLKLFSLFISSSKHTAAFERNFVNVLNDGVFTEDFLKTKLAHMLASKYFDKLKPAFEERLEKIRRYSPYQHPEAPFLSAKYMWQHYSPGLFENLEKICAKTEVDEEFFTLLVDLYLAQIEFPGEYLKRVLTYSQSQYSWIHPDSRLTDEDFALFGFHSLSDWFGEGFIDMVSQFVLNGAIYAEQNGCKVTSQEAKESMLYNIAKLNSKEEIKYKTVLHFLGFKEKKAIEIWQKVLLFRRVFNDFAKSTVLDSDTLDQFSTFALERGKIDLYQMQRPFVFNEFTDLLRFQLYVENICDQKKTDLTLPEKILDTEVIASKAKDLVKNTYDIEIARMDLSKKASVISIREMEAWQIEENNWKILTGKFFELSNTSDAEERFCQLDSLDDKKRSEVDLFSRSQILAQKEHELLDELNELEKEIMTVEIYANGQTNLEGIENTDKFAAFLKNAKGAGVYKQKESLLYVNLLSKGKSLLTFSEALNNGALDRMLDDVLEKSYSSLKITSPQNFKNEKGEFKPLPEVRDLVGVYHFSYLLKAIDEDCHSTSWIKGMGPKEFYARNRFYKHLSLAREAFDKKDDSYLKIENDHSITSQWKIVRVEKEIRKADNSSLNEHVFSTEVGALSPVVSTEKTLSFFVLKEKSIDDEARERQKQKAEHALCLTMKEELAKKVLEKIEEKSAMTFISSR